MFYENNSLPVKHSIYSKYDGQTIDAIIIDVLNQKEDRAVVPASRVF